MNATKKDTIVMIVFFALIMCMAVYYSAVLQKTLQSPLSYFETEQSVSAGNILTLN